MHYIKSKTTSHGLSTSPWMTMVHNGLGIIGVYASRVQALLSGVYCDAEKWWEVKEIRVCGKFLSSLPELPSRLRVTLEKCFSSERVNCHKSLSQTQSGLSLFILWVISCFIIYSHHDTIDHDLTINGPCQTDAQPGPSLLVF